MFVSCVTLCECAWGGVVVGKSRAGVDGVGGGASYGCLCDGNMWGESGRVGCIRSRVSVGTGGEGEGVWGLDRCG